MREMEEAESKPLMFDQVKIGKKEGGWKKSTRREGRARMKRSSD
jgi:hypothetical protein